MPRCGTSLCQRAMRARFPKRPSAAPSRFSPPDGAPTIRQLQVLYTIRRPPRNCAPRGARGARREIELEEQGGGGEWNVNLHAPPPALTSNSENGVGSKCGCSRFLLCSTCRLNRMLTARTCSLLLPTCSLRHRVTPAKRRSGFPTASTGRRPQLPLEAERIPLLLCRRAPLPPRSLSSPTTCCPRINTNFTNTKKIRVNS